MGGGSCTWIYSSRLVAGAFSESGSNSSNLSFRRYFWKGLNFLSFSNMEFDRRDLSNERLIQIYENLLWPRLIEEKMLLLLRQGRISKWFSGIGQEAIAVGATMALQEDEWIMPLHRNLGVFTTRHMPLHLLFKQ